MSWKLLVDLGCRLQGLGEQGLQSLSLLQGLVCLGHQLGHFFLLHLCFLQQGHKILQGVLAGGKEKLQMKAGFPAMAFMKRLSSLWL